METADPKRPQQPRRMQWCQPYNCIHPIPSHPTNEELFATKRPSWVTSHGDQSRRGCFSKTGSLQVWAIFFHDSGHPTSTFCGANRWKTQFFKHPLALIKRIGASTVSNMLKFARLHDYHWESSHQNQACIVVIIIIIIIITLPGCQSSPG